MQTLNNNEKKCSHHFGTPLAMFLSVCGLYWGLESWVVVDDETLRQTVTMAEARKTILTIAGFYVVIIGMLFGLKCVNVAADWMVERWESKRHAQAD